MNTSAKLMQYINKRYFSVPVSSLVGSFMPPVSIDLTNFYEITKDWLKDSNEKKALVNALVNPSPIIAEYHAKQILYPSRNHDKQELVEFFKDCCYERDASIFLTGSNGIGKTELTRAAIDQINCENGILKAVYARAHPNLGIFVSEFGLSLGIRPVGLTFEHIMTLAKLGSLEVRKEGKHRVLLVIDDVSSKLDYLNDLEAVSRHLSEITGVTVCLIGTDGTALLSMKQLQQIRVKKKTIMPLNKEQLIEVCKSYIQNDEILLQETTNLIHQEYSKNLIDIKRLLHQHCKRGKIDLDGVRRQINDEKEIIVHSIRAMCGGKGLTAQRERIEALKQLNEEYGGTPIYEEIWLERVEKYLFELNDKQSVGYKLIQENKLCHVPERRQVQIISPIINNSIREL